MIFFWIVLVTRSGLSPKIERYLFTGFLLVYLGFLQDSLDEFIDIDDDDAGHILKHLIEGLPMPIGTALTTIGLYLWSQQQIYRRQVAEQQKRHYKQASLTDPLTGLGNVKALNQQLELLFHDALNTEGQLAVLMLDIDHFKHFNDRFGHPEGDALLALFGELLQSQLRPQDQAFRYGGEEFTVLLPNCDAEAALAIAERVRIQLQLKAIHPNHQEQAYYCSVSIGIALLSEQDSIASLIKRADQALYSAKDAGRNRVHGDWMHVSPGRVS
jgi:diguanylate cyclase (GGDEF)-like protein